MPALDDLSETLVRCSNHSHNFDDIRTHWRHYKPEDRTSSNTAYTLRANALALQDIAPFSRNVVYVEDVGRNSSTTKYLLINELRLE